MQICARLYDEELIENLRGLVSQGKFHSVSEIVGRCIELALPVLAGRAGKSGNCPCRPPWRSISSSGCSANGSLP